MSVERASGNSGTNLEPGRFYGEVVNMHRRCGLQLSDARYGAGERLPRHSHELAFFCLLLDGAYSERYGQRATSYRPFTIVFHPPDETHCTQMSQRGGHVFNVELQGQWLDRLREYSEVPGTTADLHGGELVWLALRLYREYREMNLCSGLAIEGLVLEMLALTARERGAEDKRAPAWLARAVDLLHAEFRKGLTVSEVAAEVGVHPFYLSRVFRRFYRQSVSDYVHKLRVQFACGELSDPQADLASVALAAGFADQSHFTRVFKRLTGLTPGGFRSRVTPPAKL
jgi:AraC family transcriptional regulator